MREIVSDRIQDTEYRLYRPVWYVTVDTPAANGLHRHQEPAPQDDRQSIHVGGVLTDDYLFVTLPLCQSSKGRNL